MVERIKLGYKITSRAIEQVYDILVLFASGAAVAKLADQPHVHSAIGSMPLWQVVAGIILAGVIVREYKLRSKE